MAANVKAASAGTPPPAQLVLDGLNLGYGDGRHWTPVVHDVSLDLAQGHIGCLLGASGCGKTTLLRAIAGFEPLRAGSIQLDGQVLSTPQRQVAPEHRRVGMMFQDYALFPHLDVAHNIAFGLRGLDREQRRQRVDELLTLVRLEGVQRRYPHELSGGQQQRVALARALAPAPALLLLDEPFSSLDVDTRERLAYEVRDILCAAGHTALLVTHNQAEAFAIADRIGVMRDGRIEQWDTPWGLQQRPVNPFIAEFIRRDALMARRAEASERGRERGTSPVLATNAR